MSPILARQREPSRCLAHRPGAADSASSPSSTPTSTAPRSPPRLDTEDLLAQARAWLDEVTSPGYREHLVGTFGLEPSPG